MNRDSLVGVAKVSSPSDYPVSITLDNVTVRLEKVENRKHFDCSGTGCFYLFDDNNDICPYQKSVMLKPSSHSELCAVSIVLHIINASNNDFSISSIVMIDTQGFKFDGAHVCDSFLSRRLQAPSEVLSSTQSRQLHIFPELEAGIEPSCFILKSDMMEFRFEVGELSEEVRYLLKPPRPRDSVTEKIKAFIKSDSYHRFITSIQEEHIELAQESFDFVVANLASNYYSFVGNSNNVWDNEKHLIEYYPIIVSLAEIVTYPCAKKTIITIPSRALESCKTIIEKYSDDYKIYPVHIMGQDITAIILIQVFSSDDELSKTKSIGYIIWNEIEASRIQCGICSLTKKVSNTLNPEQIYLSGGRELDLSDLGRNAKAGFREDLREAFRSSWEANVARALKRTGHKYKYETQTYEMKKYTYLPDFTLEDGTILEVKGIWDIDSLGKVSEFHKTYPGTRFLTLDSEMYYDLNRKFGDTLNWERSSFAIHNNIVSIVGLSFVADQMVFERLEINSKVFLVREPENKYDNYAILVTADDGRPIGHVSAEWAVVYAPKMDAGAEYEATIKEIAPKVIKAEIVRTNIDKEILYDCFKSNSNDEDTADGQFTMTLF